MPNNPTDVSPASAIPTKVSWGEVLLFFAFATLVSAPFRLNLIALPTASTVPMGLEIFLRILKGIGPAVAYFVMRNVLHTRVPRTMSLFGVNTAASVIAALTIVAGLGIFGVTTSPPYSAHYVGILTGLMLCGYALGEEYGWRGYLQQALDPLPLKLRVVVIASFWYLWHLNFLNPQIPLSAHVVHFAGLILGSWGLLKVSKSTASLLFVAAVHLSFNVVFDVDTSTVAKLCVVGGAAAIWTVLIVRISRSQQRLSTSLE